MNKKAILGIVMSAIFIASGFAIAVDSSASNGQAAGDSSHAAAVNIPEKMFDVKPEGKAFYSGNAGVIFSGNDPYIDLGGRFYPAMWNIYSVNEGLSIEKGKITEIHMIKNDYQNSAVETLENRNMRTSYIFSFHGSMVSSNIVLKNLKSINQSFIVCYNMLLPDRNIMGITGSHMVDKAFNPTGVSIMNIRRTDDPLIFNNIIVNPVNSMPVSTVIVNYHSYAVLNMKYAVELSGNETHTIDPEVKPMYSAGGCDPAGSDMVEYGNITRGLSMGGCVFNSGGAEIGVVSETVETPEQKYMNGDHFSICVVSTFSPVKSHDYNVNCVKQKIDQTTGGKCDLKLVNYKNYFQDHHKNTGKMDATINDAFYFLNVILGAIGISIPSPTSLLSTSQETSIYKNCNNNEYKITVNAGKVTSPKAGVYWPSISYGYWTHLWGFIPEYHIKNVHEFGSCFDLFYRINHGGTRENPYYNNLQYSSTFKIIDSDLKPVEFENGNYEISISESFLLAQYYH